MPELRDLATLAEDAAREADPPGFDTLVRRARVRRRNQALALGAAAVVVVAGVGGAVAVAADGHTSLLPAPIANQTKSPHPPHLRATKAPQPGPPHLRASKSPRPGPPRLHATKSPSSPQLRVSKSPPSVVSRQLSTKEHFESLSANQVIAGGRLRSYAVASNGDVLTTWERCNATLSVCAGAWSLSHDGARIATGTTGLNRAPDAYAARGSRFIVKGYNGDGALVAPDSWTTLGRVPPSRSVTPDDVVVRDGATGLGIASPASGHIWRLPKPGGVEIMAGGVLGGDGTVWGVSGDSGGGSVAVRWLRGGIWHSHFLVSRRNAHAMHAPGTVAVAGGHVAVYSALDTGPGAYDVLAVSADNGASWTNLTASTLPFSTIDSVAATSGGTLWVTDGQRLWRSTDSSWTHFAAVQGAPRIVALEPAGATVVGQLAGSAGSTQGTARLVSIDQAGHISPVPVR